MLCRFFFSCTMFRYQICSVGNFYVVLFYGASMKVLDCYLHFNFTFYVTKTYSFVDYVTCSKLCSWWVLVNDVFLITFKFSAST